MNIKHLNLNSLFLSFLCFIFLYLLGKEINSIFKIDSISLAVSYYIIGAFTFSFVLLPALGSFLNFKEVILIYNLLLFSILLLKGRNYQKLIILLTTLLVIKIILINIDSSTHLFIQYNSDVTEFWLPMTEKIYNDNLFNAMKNNIIPGYSLMINYIYAELYFIFFSENTFTFTQVIPNIFLYLNLLLLIEINISNFTKSLLILTYLPIVLNSDWLSYLFFNSLMGEVIVNYLFSVFLVHAFQNKKINRNKFYFFFIRFFIFFKTFFLPFYLLLFLFFYFIGIKNRILFIFP